MAHAGVLEEEYLGVSAFYWAHFAWKDSEEMIEYIEYSRITKHMMVRITL
jgi:hypothetical protein